MVSPIRKDPVSPTVSLSHQEDFISLLSLSIRGQFSSVTQLHPTLCNHMDCTPDLPVHHQPLEFAQTHIHQVSDAIQSSHPQLGPSPSAFILPNISVFSSESVLRIRWPKDWSFSFSISPSSEYRGLISFRIDWFDIFTDQGTPRNLIQHHSSKASILQHSAFFMVQLSHPYMTTGKTIDLIGLDLCWQTNVSAF